MAVEKGKKVFEACKQEQVEFCKEFKSLEPLKQCLTKNKEKLSPGCRAAI